MSFNSLCALDDSTQASCVSVSSLGPDSRDQNNKLQHSLPTVYNKTQIPTSPEVRCVMSGAENTVCVSASIKHNDG